MEKIEHILLFEQSLRTFLERIGSPYPPGNRFSQSFEEIRGAFEKEEKGNIDFSRMAHFRHAVAELSELRFIVESVQRMNISQQILKEKFIKIMSGERPVDKQSKGTNDPSRNITFELFLACFLHLRNIDVTYEGLSDISIKFLDKNIAIECKRINGHPRKALKNLLRKAHQQLLRHSGAVDFGIIAINIDNVYFNDGRLAFSTNGDLVSGKFYELIKEFIHAHGDLWQGRTIINSKEFVPAVLVCLRGTVYAFDKNLTANAFFALSNNTSIEKVENIEIVKALSEKMNR